VVVEEVDMEIHLVLVKVEQVLLVAVVQVDMLLQLALQQQEIHSQELLAQLQQMVGDTPVVMDINQVVHTEAAAAVAQAVLVAMVPLLRVEMVVLVFNFQQHLEIQNQQ